MRRLLRVLIARLRTLRPHWSRHHADDEATLRHMEALALEIAERREVLERRRKVLERQQELSRRPRGTSQ